MLTKNPMETRFLREIISSFRPQLIETMPANIPELTTEICVDLLRILTKILCMAFLIKLHY